MKLQFIMLLTTLSVLFGSSMQSIAAPPAPTLTHSISGLTVTTSWTSVPGATEYKLSYAPIPYTGSESIASLNVIGITSFTATLWEGAAFYIAVQAGDGHEFSEFSNIDNFALVPASANLSGNWIMTGTQGPNDCDFTVGEKGEFPFSVTQSGNFITADMLSVGTLVLSGNLVGNTASLTGVVDNSGFGIKDITSYSLNITILSDNTFSGSFSLKEESTDVEEDCSGTSSVNGTKK